VADSATNASNATKTVEFEGQKHVFPSDFTDADISKALKSHLSASSSGIVAPEAMIDENEKNNSVIGGGARRLGEAISGLYHTVVDPPGTQFEKDVARGGGQPAVAVVRAGKGIVEGEKTAFKQSVEQNRRAEADTSLIGKGLGMARSAVTAASMADPFATGPVTNINKLEDEGRNREAIGAGTFDALSLLAGGRTGRTPSTEATVNKLARSTGADSLQPLRHVLPDLKETISKVGEPQTIGQLKGVVQDTLTRLDQKFNTALAGSKTTLVPVDIAYALEQKARSLPPTAEGQSIAQQLRSAAVEYQKPWTLSELNSERMFRNANAQAFYNKSDLRQMASMRANADNMIDKIVADSSRDVLYDEMEKQFPGQGFRELKQKQSSLLKVNDNMDKYIDQMEVAQALRDSKNWREKVTTTTSASPGGIVPRLHGLTDLIPGGGPLKNANRAVKTTFSPTGLARVRRAAILGLPVSTIVKDQGEVKEPEMSSAR
jgi:hypothetical protein